MAGVLGLGRGDKTPAAAGVMDCARGRRNREVEIGKLGVEGGKQKAERMQKAEIRKKKRILKCKNSKGSTYCSA